MKQLLFCLILLLVTLPANSKEALRPAENHDAKRVQFLTKNTDILKNQTILSLNTENSSERVNVRTRDGNSKPDSDSGRVGVGTGDGILKRVHKSKRLGAGTGVDNLQPGSKTERLGVGTGNKPKPK